MPEKKERKQVNFRLSHGARQRLAFLADQLQVDVSDVVDLAVKHLYGTALRDQQPYLFDPPPKDDQEGGGPPDAA